MNHDDLPAIIRQHQSLLDRVRELEAENEVLREECDGLRVLVQQYAQEAEDAIAERDALREVVEAAKGCVDNAEQYMLSVGIQIEDYRALRDKLAKLEQSND